LRSLALRALAFVLPLAVGSGVLEHGVRGIANSYNTKRRMLERSLETADTLVLGSSHAYWGIRPDLLSGHALNLANVSQSLYYDAAIVRRYAPRMRRLKVVVVTVSYYSLWYQLEDWEESWRQFFYERFWDLPFRVRSDPLDARHFSVAALYGPRESLSYACRRFRVNLAAEVDERGWFNYRGPRSADLEAEGARRVAAHHAFMDPRHLPENVDTLERLLASLRQGRIRAVLMTLPLSRTYRAHMRPEWWGLSRAIVADVGRRQAAPYFDYTMDARFTTDDFVDSDHLGPAGAARLSRIFEEEILAPIKRADAGGTREGGEEVSR
jgi:hypothetical protein